MRDTSAIWSTAREETSMNCQSKDETETVRKVVATERERVRGTLIYSEELIYFILGITDGPVVRVV